MNDEGAERSFVVRSVVGAHRLEFSGPVRHGSDEFEDGSFTASFRGDHVTASVHVVDLVLSRWADLFSAMAREWRGWDGAKEQASLEGHFALSCTADYLGHVSIRAVLRDDFARSNWLAEQTIVVEAGQLDDLARGAAEFFR